MFLYGHACVASSGTSSPVVERGGGAQLKAESRGIAFSACWPGAKSGEPPPEGKTLRQPPGMSIEWHDHTVNLHVEWEVRGTLVARIQRTSRSRKAEAEARSSYRPYWRNFSRNTSSQLIPLSEIEAFKALQMRQLIQQPDFVLIGQDQKRKAITLDSFVSRSRGSGSKPRTGRRRRTSSN